MCQGGALSEIQLASICVHIDDLSYTVFFSFLKFRQWALGGRKASGMVLRSQGQTVLRSQADQAGFLQVTRRSAIAETK